ncbi:zinc-dependent alcohol dehydrogenase family protein [Pantoea stewartii subsp. indologenes]|uniref:zinc-dependent alcohol dehydrogenase family protein n=1 Tax=Pantoea stewartii TaxID=66269 RepID=UPI003FA42FBF
MRLMSVPESYELNDLALFSREELLQPGPGQVLIRNHAVSLNYRDLLVVTGFSGWKPPPGRIPCSDAAGEVIATGRNVSRFRTGDRVMTSILPNWRDGQLTVAKREGGLGGPVRDGVLASVFLAEEESIVAVPDYLSDVEAATLPTAALTAWHAITRAQALRSDATVLIGGTGGVSIFALQIALAAGARVLMTSGSDKKGEKVVSLGADAAVNYLANPDWSQEILSITNGRGVDLAVDIGGASTLNESVRSTMVGGTTSIVGLAGGLHASINLAEVFQRNIRIDGIETGSVRMLEDMLEWFSLKKIRPLVHQVFKFEDSRQAFNTLKQGNHIGKICIQF